jgi:hypothetical protein
MLPEFQRDFRWELYQTYDLFDSLIREIFIGSIIYGKPSFGMTLREIDQRPRKGKGSNIPLKTMDYSTSEISKLAQSQNLRVVLDGQQRVTSIYRAMTGIDTVYVVLHSHLHQEHDAASINQLLLEDMVDYVAGEDNPLAISVKLSDAYETEHNMLDDEDLNIRFANTAFAQSYFKIADESSRKIAERLYRRAIRRLVDLYKKQKLVSYYLFDMSMEKFCLFFERSNSRVMQLNFTDILAAKLYHGFNLRKKIEEFESQNQFIKLNREIIVRAIAYIVATDQNHTVSIDRKFILDHLDADNFKEHWDTACKLYVESLRYLANQHYILSQGWMPSENMIIPLMIFRRHIKSFDQMNEEQRKFLEYWYWASIFANRYSAASNEVIIVDSGALTQVARGERVTTRGYFMKMRPLITEADDLFSYTKKSSAIYRGILNLLGYAAQGLRDWNSTHKIDITMSLEDHHIYPRAYITGGPPMEDITRAEAEQVVDCVVNRTLIPKLLNIQVGKKGPTEYLAEIKNKNKYLEDCLPSHLIPVDMISDETWNCLFKLFLEERAQRIFSLIERYTTDQATEISARYGIQIDGSETIKATGKLRLKDMLAIGKIQTGERVFTRKQPDRFATIVDGDNVEFEGKLLSINTWGQQMTGWSAISIYDNVLLERTGQPLKSLRDELTSN